MTTLRTQLADQTRESIIRRGMEVMAAQGYTGTSISQIADDLGLTRGAVYGHFPTKALLFEEIMLISERPLLVLVDELLDDPNPAPDAVHTFMLKWMLLLEGSPEYRASAEIFFNKSEMTAEVSDVYRREVELTTAIIKGLSGVIREGIRDGEIDGGVNIRRASIQTYSQLMGLTHAWLFNPKLFSLKANARPMIDTFVAGLLPPPGG